MPFKAPVFQILVVRRGVIGLKKKLRRSQIVHLWHQIIDGAEAKISCGRWQRFWDLPYWLCMSSLRLLKGADFHKVLSSPPSKHQPSLKALRLDNKKWRHPKPLVTFENVGQSCAFLGMRLCETGAASNVSSFRCGEGEHSYDPPLTSAWEVNACYHHPLSILCLPLLKVWVKVSLMQKASTRPSKPSLNHENRAWVDFKCWLSAHGWTELHPLDSVLPPWGNMSELLMGPTLFHAAMGHSYAGLYCALQETQSIPMSIKFSKSLLWVTQMWILFFF